MLLRLLIYKVLSKDIKHFFLSTKCVDYVEEPMKYQAFLHHFGSVGGWLKGSWGGWVGGGYVGCGGGRWVGGGYVGCGGVGGWVGGGYVGWWVGGGDVDDGGGGWVGGGDVGAGGVGYYNFPSSTSKIKSFDKILTSERNIFLHFSVVGEGQT